MDPELEDDFTPEEPIEEAPAEEVEDQPESEEDESESEESESDEVDAILELQAQVASLTIGLESLIERVNKLAEANFDILMDQPAGESAPAPADVDSEPVNPADSLFD